MTFYRASAILYCILFTWVYPGECDPHSYRVENIYFNKAFTTYYLSAFDINNTASQPFLYEYKITSTAADCPDPNDILYLSFELAIQAPEIGFKSLETFYKGRMEISNMTSDLIFRNTDISFAATNVSGGNFSLVNYSGPETVDNLQVETLVSYISQSGKLPNGKYLFRFKLLPKNDENSDPLHMISEPININTPIVLDLLYPGGSLASLAETYIYTTIPIFNWYSDYCRFCEYGIRVCEYDPAKHGSLQDALSDWSLIPINQEERFHNILGSGNSFYFPSHTTIRMEAGKYYVWQIRRNFNTTIGQHYDYSPINIFEVRAPDKSKLDSTDPYLSVIESLIGQEQFNLWFNAGGELERFTTSGQYIWINNEEIPIEGLYSILFDFNQEKIFIKDIELK